MKKLIIAALVAGFATSPVYASELEDHCVAVTEESGGDSSGCSCLADAADAAVTEELLAVTAETDLEGLSDASKEAIGMCFPDAA